MERVNTVAMRTDGAVKGTRHARITNVGMQGYRGKIVPFYYLHWWDLRTVAGQPNKCHIKEYELLKGSYIKFMIGAMPATLAAHKNIQANIRAWAVRKKTEANCVPKGPK